MQKILCFLALLPTSSASFLSMYEFLPVYDQGSASTCTLHATSSAIDYLIMRHYPMLEMDINRDLVIQQLYQNNNVDIQDIKNNLPVLIHSISNQFECEKLDLIQNLNFFEVTKNDLHALIDNNVPIVLEIDLVKEFNDCDANSFHIDRSSASTRGVHSVLIIGYDSDHTMWIHNSWGSAWGLNGRAIFTQNFLNQYGKRAYAMRYEKPKKLFDLDFHCNNSFCNILKY